MSMRFPQRGSQRPRQSESPRGFTLVELLVVIGVIAILISLLMPALNGARAQAQSARCLSNLRTIGQAMHLYTSEHKNFVVPGFIRMIPVGASRGEETWATMLATLGYIKSTVSQLELGGDQGGSPPGENTWDNIESIGDTVFRCPAGLNNKVGGDDPTSHTDPVSSFFHRRQSQLINGAGKSHIKGAMVDNWYGCNAIIPTAASLEMLKGQDAFPMRVMGHNRDTGRIFGGPLTKVTQIKKSAEIAMVYDGLAEHDYNTNKISARHAKNTRCNMLFADGHAEAIHLTALPSGDKQANSDLRNAKQANQIAHPKWRLDQ